MGAINTEEAARRLARVILSDIELYSRERPQEGETLEAQIEEGRRLFGSRVTPALAPLFGMVLADRQAGGWKTPEVIASPAAASAVSAPVARAIGEPTLSQAAKAAARTAKGSVEDQPTPGPRIAARALEDQPTPGPVVAASVLNGKVTTTRPIRRAAPRVPPAEPKPFHASAPAGARLPPAAPVPALAKAPATSVPADPMLITRPVPLSLPAQGAATDSVHTAAPSAPDVAVPVLTSRFSFPKLFLALAAVAGTIAFLIHFVR